MSSLAIRTTPAAASRPPVQWEPPDSTRCECRRCGIHTFRTMQAESVERCQNCGSAQLVPVADATPGLRRVS